jgi:hypothetical protein
MKMALSKEISGYHYIEVYVVLAKAVIENSTTLFVLLLKCYQHVGSLLKVRNISSSCSVLYFLNVVILIPFVVKNVVYVTIS